MGEYGRRTMMQRLPGVKDSGCLPPSCFGRHCHGGKMGAGSNVFQAEKGLARKYEQDGPEFVPYIKYSTRRTASGVYEFARGG